MTARNLFLELAGTRLKVDETAGTLLYGPDRGDETYGYPLLTLKHYDQGWLSSQQQEEEAVGSPRDRVTIQDLGRATLFGAFRGWRDATNLLRAASDSTAPWPEQGTDWKLDADPSLDDRTWLEHPDTQAAWNLYWALARGSVGGWREAGASKVLHLKWPEFFPVLDGELQKLYRDAALERERSSIPGSRRTKHPSTRAFWLAIRADLIDNNDALSTLRSRLRDHDSDQRERAQLLGELTDLRLMDCVAWSHQMHGQR